MAVEVSEEQALAGEEVDAWVLAAKDGSIPGVQHPPSTPQEREAAGWALVECHLDVKRALAPMLSYAPVQEALVAVFRAWPDLVTAMDASRKARFQGILEALRKLSEGQRRLLPQRHESWVDRVRDQTDFIPGERGDKQVVNVHELAEILNLANEMRLAGNASFNEHDFGMAVTRYLQILRLFEHKSVLREEDQTLIHQTTHTAHRNLSLAALKNWEWGRACRAADEVLSSQPNDRVVLLRKAEACEQLGRVDDALSAVDTVLRSPDLVPKSPEDRKARRLRRQIVEATKQSDRCLRDAMQQSLERQFFSDQRPKPESAPPSPPPLEQTVDAPRLVSRQSESRQAALPPASTDRQRRLSLTEVREIQVQQQALFSEATVQARLNEMRLAADFEEVRFLHRVQPLKLEVQLPLLKRYGFAETPQGMRDMERAVAAYMADQPDVGQAAKQVALLVMGDIWPEEGD